MPLKRTDYLYLFIIATILFALALSGCINAKKATNYMKNHPETSSKFCLIQYPIKDSIIVKDSVYFDTLYEVNPNIKDSTFRWSDLMDSSLNNQSSISDSSNTLCKPVIIKIIKTIRHDSLVFKENPATKTYYELLLQGRDVTITKRNEIISKRDAEITQWKTDFKDMKASRNKFRLWFWIIVGAISATIGISIFLKIKKVIPK